MEILDFLISMIEKYGYIIVILTIMLESAGIPMPGETALIVAAAFAGTGHLDITLVIICAASGAIIGDAGGYWIGRKLGRPFLDKHGKWLHLTQERMYTLEKLFVKHGPMTVFFGRFFSLLRTYAALFAGVWHMKYALFTLFNALGGITWAVCFGILGYVFGQNLSLLEKIAKTIGWALSIPVVLIILSVVIWRWTIKHQERLKLKLRVILQKSGLEYIRKRFSWQIHWILRHWTATQYTIIHITIGLCIASAGIFSFVRVAYSAFSDRKIAEWDSFVFTVFQSWTTPLSALFFKSVTLLGSYGVITAALSCILLMILKKKWLYAISAGVMVIGGQLLVLVLKMSFERASPITEDPALLSWFGFSFPSGHAMGSLIVYGMIAYFIILWSKKWVFSTGVTFIALLLVSCIALSRVALGENYLSDVLCGLAGGIVWLSSCLTALELLRRGHVGDRRRNKRMLINPV